MAKVKGKKQKSKSSKVEKQQARQSEVAQSLVSLVLPGAKFLGVENGGLQGRMAEGDLLFNIYLRAAEIVAYKEGLQELRRLLVRQVQKRFPILAPLAEEQAALVKDAEVLYNMIDAIIDDAKTVEQARRVLEEAHQGQ